MCHDPATRLGSVARGGEGVREGRGGGEKRREGREGGRGEVREGGEEGR